MAGWTTCTGQALILPIDNVDTDQLIPARFMSVPRSEGYGTYLLHDMRRDADGSLSANFALNQHMEVSILVAGCNFGCGSSREAAVYALVDAGIRAVIAPSFSDIFASNAVNNGLLPALIGADDAEALSKLFTGKPAEIAINLRSSTLRCGQTEMQFQLQDSWRTKLISGLDDIDLTLQHKDKIRSYQNIRYSTSAWAWPAPAN